MIANGDGSLSMISANWNSTDPDSIISMYRYAIGTSPGSRDIVNWTYSPETSVVRTGLILTQGQKYYVTAQARNEAGLWS